MFNFFSLSKLLQYIPLYNKNLQYDQKDISTSSKPYQNCVIENLPC